MAAPRYNLNNPAVKRILQEVKEMQRNPSNDYTSLPLEDNLYEWQFAIRGPPDSEFEGGIYHGRIQLPPEYPFKPPAFMLLTPNGRFETQTKICLSISQYHPEQWQPSWSVRTALVALIAFMPTKANGAIGSLEFSKEERKALALKSVESPPKYGTPERQKVIDEIHEEMIKKTNSVADATGEDASVETFSVSEIASEPEEQLVQNVANTTQLLSSDFLSGEAAPPPIASAHTVTPPAESRSAEGPTSAVRPPPRRQQASEDQVLTLLAIGLVVALAALLMKKAFGAHWWINF